MVASKSYSKKIWLVLVVVIVAAIAAIVLSKPEFSSQSGCSADNLYPSQVGVQLSADSKKLFNLEYAKTTSQQDEGLSLRQCLPDNGGLLFLFPTDDRFGIWMKQMKFPIDVVWLDADKKIVTIEKNMQPSSYPKVYYPTENARYVLELNKGAVDSLGVHTGSQLSW